MAVATQPLGQRMPSTTGASALKGSSWSHLVVSRGGDGLAILLRGAVVQVGAGFCAGFSCCGNLASVLSEPVAHGRRHICFGDGCVVAVSEKCGRAVVAADNEVSVLTRGEQIYLGFGPVGAYCAEKFHPVPVKAFR